MKYNNRIIMLRKHLIKLIIGSVNEAIVIENIQRWIAKGNEARLNTFCRPDNSKIGYRFVNDDDFLETIEEELSLLRRKVKIVFTRYADSRDHLWSLYFSVRKITAEIHYNGQVHLYKNDNQLRLFLRNID